MGRTAYTRARTRTTERRDNKSSAIGSASPRDDQRIQFRLAALLPGRGEPWLRRAVRTTRTCSAFRPASRSTAPTPGRRPTTTSASSNVSRLSGRSPPGTVPRSSPGPAFERLAFCMNRGVAMRKQLLGSGRSIWSAWPSCLDWPLAPAARAGGQGHGGPSGQDGGQRGRRRRRPADGGCKAGASSSTYVLIDDMETTTHGPIQLAMGIAAPLTAGYWYNSGAGYYPDAGIDKSNPPPWSFAFSALPTPTKTLGLQGQRTRGPSVLRAQRPLRHLRRRLRVRPGALGDAGATSGNTGAGGAGDGGASVPQDDHSVRHQPLQGHHLLGDDDDARLRPARCRSRFNSPIRTPTRASAPGW